MIKLVFPSSSIFCLSPDLIGHTCGKEAMYLKSFVHFIQRKMIFTKADLSKKKGQYHSGAGTTGTTGNK